MYIQFPKPRANDLILAHLIESNTTTLCSYKVKASPASTWAAGTMEREVEWAGRTLREQLFGTQETNGKDTDHFRRVKHRTPTPMIKGA